MGDHPTSEKEIQGKNSVKVSLGSLHIINHAFPFLS